MEKYNEKKKERNEIDKEISKNTGGEGGVKVIKEGEIWTTEFSDLSKRVREIADARKYEEAPEEAMKPMKIKQNW